MSRIHEALQRAYLERGKLSVAGDIQISEPESELVPNVLPAVKAEVVLEHVAKYPWKPSSTSLPTLGDRGASVEQFRSLRSHIYQARYESPLKIILVASGMPSEGKSFVAANLAVSLARNSVQNILLIDGDLRRPTLHTLLGAPNNAGLSEYLEGRAELADILQRDSSSKEADSAAGGIPNLTFIPSGKHTDKSSELVSNQRIKELIETVSPSFDWIVIDAPPALVVTDAVELARAADAVLLVARGATTPYDIAQRTKAAFTNARILGFVLNDVKDAPRAGYAYNGYYYNAPSSNGQSSQTQAGS